MLAPHPLADLTAVDHDRTTVPVGERVLLGPAARLDSRVVSLAGARNFRDLGGYGTADGHTVAWSRLYRSENLSMLEERDVVVFGGLGIQAVCDFRRDDEVAERPSRLPHPAPPIVRLAMSDTLDADRSTIDAVQAVFHGLAPVPPVDFWDQQYVAILERGRPLFVRWFETMAATSGAVVFHCAGGKDRTGLAAMLLLSWLEVSDEDIVDDFDLTNALRTPGRIATLRPDLAKFGVVAEDAAHLIGVRRESIAFALAYVRAEHGGAEGYLRGGGLSAGALQQVRSRMLV